MKRILVVYYSRTGATKKLACTIAQLLDADLEEIVDRKKRAGLLGYIRTGRDAALKKQTKIQKIFHDIASYDVLCIGTPVRDFTMSSAIRTYLTEYEHLLPDVLIFFCTQANAGAETAIQEMATIVGKTPLTSMVYSTKEIFKDQYMDHLKDHLGSVGLLDE